MGSVLYDAVLVAGGACSADALRGNGAALRSIAEAYKQARPVGALGEGVGLLRDARLPGVRLSDAGSADGNAEEFAAAFAHAIEGHRHFERQLAAVLA